jgi:hypothetical protein
LLVVAFSFFFFCFSAVVSFGLFDFFGFSCPLATIPPRAALAAHEAP